MNDLRLERGERTRNLILQAAIAMIAEKGLNEISTAMLAKAAGVSKSTIFHHFSTSDEILIEALQVIFGDMQQSMDLNNCDSVESILSKLGQVIVSATETNLINIKAFLAFFHGGIYHPVFRNILASYAAQMHEQFRLLLSERVSEQVSGERIASVSKLILPMVDGIGFHYLLHGDRATFEQVWQLQTQSILALLDT